MLVLVTVDERDSVLVDTGPRPDVVDEGGPVVVNAVFPAEGGGGVVAGACGEGLAGEFGGAEVGEEGGGGDGRKGFEAEEAEFGDGHSFGKGDIGDVEGGLAGFEGGGCLPVWCRGWVYGWWMVGNGFVEIGDVAVDAGAGGAGAVACLEVGLEI